MELMQAIIQSHPFVQEMEPEALHSELEILLDNGRDNECSIFKKFVKQH